MGNLNIIRATLKEITGISEEFLIPCAFKKWLESWGFQKLFFLLKYMRPYFTK